MSSNSTVQTTIVPAKSAIDPLPRSVDGVQKAIGLAKSWKFRVENWNVAVLNCIFRGWNLAFRVLSRRVRCGGRSPNYFHTWQFFISALI
ncbi:MAG: hypothetical protein HC769_19340 [Cyanobacteria bacterium CRU_2_1]|nr:hypothetical protein [Cyanobacteria bacterium RU_5_0]NJR60782.1 hypothetical protein [Cyanobacteria bacterium CRU_2_1]